MSTRTVSAAGGIATLGFGSGSLGSSIGYRDGCALVQAAFDAGFRHFDTAPPYGGGQSERIIGDVLASVRSEVVLVSKAGIAHPRAAGAMRRLRSIAQPLKSLLPGLWSRAASGARQAASPAGRFGIDEIRESLAESLRRLRTDHLDALLLHEVLPPHLSDELLELLRRLRDDGSARAVGTATGVAASVAALQIAGDRVDWVQTDHHPGAWTAALRRPGLRLSTHGPLRGGLALLDQPAFRQRLADAQNDAPTRAAALALTRRMAHADQRGVLLLRAALAQAGAGNVVLVSTLRRDRLPGLVGATVGDDPTGEVALLRRLLAAAAAGPTRINEDSR